jgi:uncharacterized protein (TIGR03435 family)
MRGVVVRGGSLWLIACIAMASSRLASQEFKVLPANDLPAFDVASVKPWDGNGRPSTRFLPDRFVAIGVTVEGLIAQAYDIHHVARLVTPKSIDKTRFEVQAVASQPGANIPQMLQRLLIERFKLRAHVEQRTLQVMELGRPRHCRPG